MISRHCHLFNLQNFVILIEDLKIMWLTRVNGYSPLTAGISGFHLFTSYSRYIRVSFIHLLQPVYQGFTYSPISNNNNNNNKMLSEQNRKKITFKKFPVSSLGIPSISQN